MSDKKYYWLKLKDDFFSQKEIKKLRRIAGGDTYTIIYLKLQLLSIKNEGKILYEGIEDTFADEMALEIDEDVDNVKFTLMYLKGCNLVEELSDSEFLLTKASECIGKEGSSAERVRRHRENAKALQCNGGVTQVKQIETKCNTEKEIDIDKEIYINKTLQSKVRYSEFVHMKKENYEKLVDLYGQECTDKMITTLDNYKGSSGKKYRDDYRAILSWVVERVGAKEKSKQIAALPKGELEDGLY